MTMMRHLFAADDAVRQCASCRSGPVVVNRITVHSTNSLPMGSTFHHLCHACRREFETLSTWRWILYCFPFAFVVAAGLTVAALRLSGSTHPLATLGSGDKMLLPLLGVGSLIAVAYLARVGWQFVLRVRNPVVDGPLVPVHAQLGNAQLANAHLANAHLGNAHLAQSHFTQAPLPQGPYPPAPYAPSLNPVAPNTPGPYAPVHGGTLPAAAAQDPYGAAATASATADTDNDASRRRGGMTFWVGVLVAIVSVGFAYTWGDAVERPLPGNLVDSLARVWPPTGSGADVLSLTTNLFAILLLPFMTITGVVQVLRARAASHNVQVVDGLRSTANTSRMARLAGGALLSLAPLVFYGVTVAAMIAPQLVTLNSYGDLGSWGLMVMPLLLVGGVALLFDGLFPPYVVDTVVTGITIHTSNGNSNNWSLATLDGTWRVSDSLHRPEIGARVQVLFTGYIESVIAVKTITAPVREQYQAWTAG